MTKAKVLALEPLSKHSEPIEGTLLLRGASVQTAARTN